MQIEPEKPYQNIVASLVEQVVLKPKSNKGDVVKPAKLDLEPIEWANLAGGKAAGNRATAYFDSAAVRAIGAFEAIVVTPHGERKCSPEAGDLKRVLR